MLRPFLLALLSTACASAAAFTGMAIHGTTAAGVNLPAAARWNTLGGGTLIPNIYLFDGGGSPLNPLPSA